MCIANYNLPLDSGWLFHHGKVTKYYDAMAQNCKAGGHLGNLKRFKEENSWQEIRVPHDWCIFLPYDKTANAWSGYKVRGEGWYYKEINLSSDEIQNARLVFEGVMGVSVVYVNGNVVKRNFSGYNRFTCDLSCYLVPNQVNTIVIHVDGTSWEAWSYEGAGLYRPCYIEFRENTKIDTDNCFVKTAFVDNIWQVVANIKTENAKNSTLEYQLLSDDSVVFESKIAANDSVLINIPIKNPKLWSPENPNLYKFSCELLNNGEVIDAFSCNVGFRDIVWDKDKGMLLNGKKYQIKGICCHQDHGGVGIAVTPEIIKYRILKLKELGVNAYRCAHHAVCNELFEICDRLGMLVMAENRHYSVCEDVLNQIESLVKVARNHPSVFLYSLFNEEPLQGEKVGYLLAKKMREHILKFDDTRAITGAMESGIVETLNASDALDVVGANYGNQDYKKYHDLKPNKALLGTENCPTFATRGVYKTDNENKVYDCYGSYWAGFTLSISDTMKSVIDNEYCAGCFAWSGFDSYGEPQPHDWPSICSHWGFMDICGFKKDTAHLLSAWYKTDLVAHLLPHWNWQDGEKVKVSVFTNGDSAELFLNGKSLGVKSISDRRADWEVDYKAGDIKVIVKRGNEEISDQVFTAGEPYRLKLQDVTPKCENQTVRIINVSVVDKNDRAIPNFNGVVNFSGKNLTVLGVCNGNPNGLQPNVAGSVPLFNGRAQLIATANSLDITATCGNLIKTIR